MKIKKAFLPFFLCLTVNVFAQTEPAVSFSQHGTVAPNAVVLDVSEIGEFREGYAIVRKERDFAVMDKDGKIFLPFGKFKFNEKQGHKIDPACGFVNGMSIVRDPETELYGFINQSGTLVVPCTLNEAESYMKDGFGWGSVQEPNGKKTGYFFDKSGKRFAVRPGAWFEHSRGIPEFIYRCYNNRVWNFYTKTGRPVLTTKRNVQGDFREGLIRVDSSIGLAGTKTGYIDTANRLVIPHRFSVYMRDFYDGLALLIGSSGDEFRYAFINKAGEIAIRLKDPGRGYSVGIESASHFRNGLLFTDFGDDHGFINTAGNFLSMDKAIIERNPDFVKHYKAVRLEYRERSENHLRIVGNLTWEEARMSSTGGFNSRPSTRVMKSFDGYGYGIVDLTGKIVYEPVFTKIGFPDPVSGRAEASVTDRKTGKVTEGYVNENGVFVMVVKSAGQ